MLFAQDFSTAEVADALVARYPERSTGDPKADHRWAKEAVCTVNPNDSRYNAEKRAKQYGLMQANHVKGREKRIRQLESKSERALNAAFDILEPTISSLSPKERLTLLPKALLPLIQAVKSVNPPVTRTEQETLEREAEEGAQIQAEIEEYTNRIRPEIARDRLWEGESFDEITRQTRLDEDQIKNDLARQRVDGEVIGMIKSGLNREEIQEQTNLPYAYIDRLMENPDEDRIYRFALPEEEPPTDDEKIGALSGNGSGENLAAKFENSP
ncbi:MAG: hypothetical protein OXP71_03715 [Candidatus Poribacteria bacterium]|nr:hypothetical protein [Candidatus Poribacteria bacterium]